MNIKKTIKDNGWTLEALRARMQQIEGHEIKQSSMSRIANSANPTVETLQRLANAMDIDICAFFADSSTHGSSFVCPYCGRGIKINIEKE